MVRNVRRRRSSQNPKTATRHKQIQPKIFKSEGRETIRTKNKILDRVLFEVEEVLELKNYGAGCVGQINPGTVIRFNLVRRNAIGDMYFFDVFAKNSSGDLKWIGEFDTLSIDDIAFGVGRELESGEYGKLLIPDASGVFSEVVGDTVVSETVTNAS